MHVSRPALHFPLVLTVAALFVVAALLPSQTRAQFDNTAPLLLAANVDGTSLVLIYSELLNESPTPATTDFTVDIGGTDYTPSSVAVLGAEVALTLSTGAANGDTVSLDYTVGSNPVEDPAGNDVQALTSWSVTNHTGATNDRPEFSSDTITISVEENTPSLTAFGDPVAATDDDTGDTLTYELHSTVVPTFFIDTSTGQISVFGNLDFETTSSYVAPMYVRDSKTPAGDADTLWDDSIKVTISINNVNEEPTIAGDSAPDVDENTTVVGTYTVSDPDTADTHTWSIDSDTSVEENQDGSLFEIDSTSGELSFKNAPDYETPGSATTPASNTYQVTIKVTDNGSPAMSDTFDVVVDVTNVNEGPDITTQGSSHTAISKPEGTGPSDALATYAADDPEDDTLTWTLGGNDASDFTINSSGELRFQALTDYEDPRDHDTNNAYNVTVRVRDSKINTVGSTNGDADMAVDDSINVVVTITNIDEPGTVTLPGTITAGQAVTATLTDHDGNTSSESWQWSRSDTPGGTFTPISGATSNPYTPVAADVGKYLKATASYTDPHDSGKSATSAASSQVAVGNINPSFSAMSATRSVPENSGAGVNVGAAVSATPGDADTLHYWLTGMDASSFDIVSTSGQIQTKSGITYNFESKSSYSVTVNVRDNKDEAGDADTVTDDTIDVTVNLSNVDEPGTVAIAGTEEGGQTLTASVTDIDGTVSGLTWKWELGAVASGPFAPISGATSNTYTTVAMDVNRFLRATASYTDPQGSGKSANAVTGRIGASNNEPSFSSENASRSVPENSGQGTNVGAAVSTTDDDGDTLHYSLSGTDASSFDIDSGTGQITTKNGITYNYESRSFYSVTVHVRDSKDAAGNANNSNDDDITVSIHLTDVNEQPAITTPQTSISVEENQTSVLTYLATDVDSENNESHDSANTLTWSVETADDGSFFEIGSSSGVLTFKDAPNFEDKQDAGADNVYNVTVTVTDNGIDGARGASNHLSISKSLAVTVTDVNETPTLTTAPSSATFDENATGVVATYIATDPDATTGTMIWDLQGNDAGDFNITSNVNGTAQLTFKNPPDYERPDDTGGNNVYDVTVRVRDNGSPRLEDTQAVAITVNDLNETPVIAGNAGPSFAEIEFDHTATASELVIGTYTATDDDNADNAGLQTITFDVSGADAAHFSIDANTGVLSFSISPDFENPADLADSNMMGASDNMYEIVVRANDGQGGTGIEESVGTFTVTVTVTNVNETPEVPAGVPDESFAEIEWDADSADLDVMAYVPRDEETSTLTALSWSLAGTDAADFQITVDSTTGHGTLSFRDRPDFEDPTDRANAGESHVADDNMYEVIVRISDGPNTRDYPLTVTVTNVDETPGFTSLSTGRHADEVEYDSGTTASDLSSIPATVANQAYWYAFEARDEEGQDIVWTITGPDAADFVIAEDPGFVMTADADERAIARWNIVPDFENPQGSSTDVGPQGYVFTVNASDGTNTARHEVFIRIFDVNERPEFTGTIETAIALDEHDATLDADFQEPPYAFPTIATYTGRDEEGGVTWSLTGTDAGDFEIDSGGNVTFREMPSFEDPKDSGGGNVYNFTVVVTDILSKTNRRTAMQPVTVTVRDIEETGVIRVSNLDPVVGDTITFTLSDPDGEIDTSATNISWTLRAQESGVWQPITIGGGAATTLRYTVDEDDAGKPLRAEVSYFDRRNADRNLFNRKMLTSGETSPVEADPLPNVKPRFRSGSSQAIEEGEAGRVLPERVTATDRDGDNLTFGIQPGQDSALFEIDASSGQVTAVGALDFETAGTGGLLFFTVTLHDGKGLDVNDMVINDDSIDATTVVSVRVIDVEEEGVVTLSDQEPEAGTQLTATLTDGDGGITGRSWQWWRSQDGRTGWSPISGATNNSYTPTVADEDSYLRATVEYTDRRGGGKRAEAITNPVPSENRRPLFPSSETGQRMVNENSRAGANIGAPVAAEDPERDRLTYSLTGADAAAFTIVQSTGQVRVKDALDFETKSSYSVIVEVHDGKDGTGATSTTIDDTQPVAITVVNVDEPGTVTLTSETATIQARVPVTASLEDDDGPTSIQWQWARSRSSTTGWANISGATLATFTPADTDIGGYIRATASYDDGEDAGKTAVRVSPRVGQAPPVNSAPAFPATEDGRREIAEDATGGTAVGDPVAATDFNDDTLTYSLSGTDAALFTVDSSTGQIRVASGADLDFETKRTLRVTVEVTDGANALGDPDNDAIDDRQNVTITLTDVNEAPVLSGDAAPSVAENLDRAVAAYTGTDPERDTLTWSVTGSTFWISQRGQLHFATPPSYEDGTSHSVTVTAEDEDGLSDSLVVSVTVTDVEEPGAVTIEPRRGWDGTSFQAELDDDDNVIGSASWQWQRSSNRSSWGDVSGATSRFYTASADDVGQYLRATATYEDGRGSGKEASLALTGRIGDSTNRPATNNAPEFSDTTAERSVGQGTAAGRNIGAPVRATDADSDDILIYSLGGADAGLFDIEPATGQLKTRGVLDYDEEGTNTYEVEVSVHDGFNSSYSPSTSVDATVTVTITVTQVARRSSGGGGGGGGGGSGGGGGGFVSTPVAPRFADGARTARSLPVTAQAGEAVGDPVAATHPNNDDLTYTLSGTNANVFAIDAETGQVRLGEGATLALGQTYTVDVTATDESRTGARVSVDIEVVEDPTDPYDLNGNGAIEKEEAITAVFDYFAGTIEKEAVEALLARYRAG